MGLHFAGLRIPYNIVVCFLAFLFLFANIARNGQRVKK